MYAVIRTGTSQERVAEGQVVRVDLRSEALGSSIEFQPVLVV
ncbi:MAG: 50S ribosomal protein L21, partial [Actinobacteria bacterium]|nr:50S ribosomal protein L21 [Actinomycetota bacterium]